MQAVIIDILFFGAGFSAAIHFLAILDDMDEGCPTDWPQIIFSFFLTIFVWPYSAYMALNDIEE